MADEYIGSLISVDCGSALGIYQGKIQEIGSEGQTITLEQPYRNGKPYGVEKVVLRTEDITNISYLKSAEDFEKPKMVKAPKPNGSRTPGVNRGIVPGQVGKVLPLYLSESHGNIVNKPKRSAHLRRHYSECENIMGHVLGKENVINEASSSGQPQGPSAFFQTKGSTERTQDGHTTRGNDASNLFGLIPSSASHESINQTGTKPASRVKKERIRSITPDPIPTNSLAAEEWQPYTILDGLLRGNRGKRGRGGANGKGRGQAANNDDGGRRGRDVHLLTALDTEELNEDFDFEGNLALFDKRAFNAENTESDVGKEKMKEIKNFRNDENIIKDETRVTSWVPCHSDNESSDQKVLFFSGGDCDDPQSNTGGPSENGRIMGVSPTKEIMMTKSVSGPAFIQDAKSEGFKTKGKIEIPVPTVSRSVRDEAVMKFLNEEEGSTSILALHSATACYQAIAIAYPDLISRLCGKAQLNGKSASTKEVVIATGKDDVLRKMGLRLGALFANRHSNGAACITIIQLGSDSDSQGRAVSPPSDDAETSSLKLQYPGITVIPNGKVSSLPRSREAALVICLLSSAKDSPQNRSRSVSPVSLPISKSSFLSPLMEDWIRSASAHAVTVSLGPFQVQGCSSTAKKLGVFLTVSTADEVEAAKQDCEKSTQYALCDAGIPFHYFSADESKPKCGIGRNLGKIYQDSVTVALKLVR